LGLQHPQDYIEVLKFRACCTRSGIDPADVIGLGFDFTACTMLPIDANGAPLCFDETLKDNPHGKMKRT
jgi:L-ribulokinase